MLNSSKAACGGLIRDETGKFFSGFLANLGVCSITIAKVWGAFYGLKLAWDKGLRNVLLEMDSTSAISLITDKVNPLHPFALVIKRVHDLIQRSWNVRIKHIFREANRAADGLANLGHSHDLVVVFYSFSPIVLSSILWDDLVGVALPYFVG